MPAVSKAQYALMQAIAHGRAKKKAKGISKKEAAEYVSGQSPKGLPKRKKASD